MENAAEALKLAFGILVFIVGLAVLFNMTSKEVSRVLISETDRTNSYLYYDSSKYTQKIDTNTGNRIVTMNEIIPVLYRYAEENYAVTIVDKSGAIIARFDLDTEAMCNSWEINDNDRKASFVTDIKEVFEKVNKLVVTTNKVDLTQIGDSTHLDKMQDLLKKIYKQNTSGTIRRNYYCFWAGNMGWTAQRIDSDLSRNKSKL